MVTLNDLRRVPRPGNDGADLVTFDQLLKARGVRWPISVVEQLLFDHGDKDEFLEQYGHLELNRIVWELRSVKASELVRASHYAGFTRVEEVADHPHYTLKLYRSPELLALRPDPWTDTWAEPPIFIEGALRRPPQRQLHLVEGHTRLGVLQGPLRLGEVAADSVHKAYIGSDALAWDSSTVVSPAG